MSHTNESDRGPGYVYLVRHPNSNGLHKIGRTTKPESRMSQLGGEDLEIVAIVSCADANEVETGLHRKYKQKRLPQSEWFNLTDTEVEEVQARLEQVFSESRRYIRLRGKNLPSLSQVRAKDRKIQELEDRLSTSSMNLEEQAKKYQQLKEAFDELNEEKKDKEMIITGQRLRIKEHVEKSKHAEQLMRSLATEVELKEHQKKESSEHLDTPLYDSEQYKDNASDSKEKPRSSQAIDEAGKSQRKSNYETYIESIMCTKTIKESSGSKDPWEPEHIDVDNKINNNSNSQSNNKNVEPDYPEKAKSLKPSEVCDENLWNPTHNPERDRAFLKAWNLGWFNKTYRPRLSDT